MSDGISRVLTRYVVPRPLRNLLRSPIKTGRWLRQEGAFVLGRHCAISIRQDWIVRCHPASDRSFALFATDPEFIGELDGFIAHCTPGMVLFDIGANFGFFCLATLKYGGLSSRVVAVDPSAVSNRILQANVRLAEGAGRVRIIRAAIGDQDGTLSMLTTGASGDHYLIATNAVRPDIRYVRQYKLSTLAELAGLEPTHLKIDVESFEAEIICGAMEFLSRSRPIIFLELHNDMLWKRGWDSGRVLECLAKCGYRRFERHGKIVERDDLRRLPIVRMVCTSG